VRKSPSLGQRHPGSSNQHGMMTRSKEKNSVSSVDAPLLKMGDRVVAYNRKYVRVPGVVAWVGKMTTTGPNAVTFTAVGIETVSYCIK